ncbi:MAG: class I lanthipeptide [Hyphomicrobiales bacterium]
MKKSLNFRKETVASLNNVELNQVQGGATYDGTPCAITIDACPYTGECTFKKCPETKHNCTNPIRTLQCL